MFKNKTNMTWEKERIFKKGFEIEAEEKRYNSCFVSLQKGKTKQTKNGRK